MKGKAMAHFYGEVTGRGRVTRTGDKSGMSAHVRGWHVGVAVDMRHMDGVDTVAVYRTDGSNGTARELVAEFSETSTVRGDGVMYHYVIAEAAKVRADAESFAAGTSPLTRAALRRAADALTGKLETAQHFDKRDGTDRLGNEAYDAVETARVAVKGL